MDADSGSLCLQVGQYTVGGKTVEGQGSCHLSSRHAPFRTIGFSCDCRAPCRGPLRALLLRCAPVRDSRQTVFYFITDASSSACRGGDAPLHGLTAHRICRTVEATGLRFHIKQRASPPLQYRESATLFRESPHTFYHFRKRVLTSPFRQIAYTSQEHAPPF